MKIGDIVEYAGYSWYVIKVGKRSMTLLAKDNEKAQGNKKKTGGLIKW